MVRAFYSPPLRRSRTQYALLLFTPQDLCQWFGNRRLQPLFKQLHNPRLAERLGLYGIERACGLEAVVQFGFDRKRALAYLYLYVRDGDLLPLKFAVSLEHGGRVRLYVPAGEVQIAQVEHPPTPWPRYQWRNLSMEEPSGLAVRGGDGAEVVLGDISEHTSQRARLAQYERRRLPAPQIDPGHREYLLHVRLHGLSIAPLFQCPRLVHDPAPRDSMRVQFPQYRNCIRDILRGGALLLRAGFVVVDLRNNALIQ